MRTDSHEHCELMSYSGTSFGELISTF